MNYRRRFQRVYAALTVAWIAVLLFMLPADRLRFWQAEIWQSTYDHSPEAVDLSRYGTVEPTPPPPNETKALSDAKGWTVVKETPIDYGPHSAVPIPFGESPTGKSAWLASVLFLPPVLGYIAIFLVIPWIYRGFRSGTPN